MYNVFINNPNFFNLTFVSIPKTHANISMNMGIG